MQEPTALFAFGVVSGLALGFLVFGVLLVLRLLFNRGVSLVVAFWLAYGAATAFVLLYLGAKSAPMVTWEWRILAGLFDICLHTCVISAAAVALATRLTLVQTAVGTAGFFLLGHASGALVAPFRDDAAPP